MDLSITKIKNNRFSSQLGGYDYRQVDELVAEVLGELDALRTMNRNLKQQELVVKRQFAVLASMKEEIVDLIVSSQKYSAKWKDRTARQAEVTIRFADREANQIIADAELVAKNNLIAKIKEAKKQADSLNKLKSMVSTYQTKMLVLCRQQLAVDSVKLIDDKAVADQELDIKVSLANDQQLTEREFEILANTNKNRLVVQDIATDTNENDELVINLSLIISK